MASTGSALLGNCGGHEEGKQAWRGVWEAIQSSTLKRRTVFIARLCTAIAFVDDMVC